MILIRKSRTARVMPWLVFYPVQYGSGASSFDSFNDAVAFVRQLTKPGLWKI